METEWLDRKMSVDEMEAANMLDGKAFGARNEEWEKLKSQMVEGDELWTFASPAASWQDLGGRLGVSLVRHGQVISSLVTLMS